MMAEEKIRLYLGGLALPLRGRPEDGRCDALPSQLLTQLTSILGLYVSTVFFNNYRDRSRSAATTAPTKNPLRLSIARFLDTL
jgi:hypothetical protein